MCCFEWRMTSDFVRMKSQDLILNFDHQYLRLKQNHSNEKINGNIQNSKGKFIQVISMINHYYLYMGLLDALESNHEKFSID